MPFDTPLPTTRAPLPNWPAAANAALHAQALAVLPFSLLLLDDARRVIHANLRAQTRLAAADGIVEVRGRLAVTGPDRDAFESGWHTMAIDPASTGRGFGVRRGGDASPLRLDVIRIDGDEGRAWLLRIDDETVSQHRLCADWSLRFGLTASECKVGVALLRHGDAVSIAAALHISGNTVRAHLKTMFAKTGVRSQAALALRLAQIVGVVD